MKIRDLDPYKFDILLACFVDPYEKYPNHAEITIEKIENVKEDYRQPLLNLVSDGILSVYRSPVPCRENRDVYNLDTDEKLQGFYTLTFRLKDEYLYIVDGIAKTAAAFPTGDLLNLNRKIFGKPNALSTG